MIVPGICAFYNTYLTNFSGNLSEWPLDFTTGNIWKDICCTLKKRVWILILLISHPPKGGKNTKEAWTSAVVTVLSPLKNLDINCPNLKWNCMDGFKRHHYSLCAGWVGDYPDEVMVAEVTYHSYLMCDILECAPIQRWTFKPLNHSQDKDVYSALLQETDSDSLHWCQQWFQPAGTLPG